MTIHKASKSRLSRVAFTATAVCAVGAVAVFGGGFPQLMAAADGAVDFMKTLTYLSAGRIPPSEQIPSSSDEMESLYPLPAVRETFMFKDVESSDDGTAADVHVRAESSFDTDSNADNPSGVPADSASADNSGTSGNSTDGGASSNGASGTDGDASGNNASNSASGTNAATAQLHIRENILDYDDGLDYGAAGIQSGHIARYTYTPVEQDPTFITLASGGQVRNCTWVTNEELAAESLLAPELKIELNGEPQVLIMHTHTTESFEPYERSYFDADFPYRSQDSSHNVVAVGERIAEKLAAAGIAVIHDGTLHDYPSYNGAYARSELTVEDYLEKYPSIKVVLDIHRDALESDDGVRIAPVTEINGRKAAQVMIISGCDDGTFGMPNYMKNFRLACLFQNTFEKYENLSRAVLFDYRKYNQHLTTGSLLIEIGGHANSLDEALYSGELVGECIAEGLLTLAVEE